MMRTIFIIILAGVLNVICYTQTKTGISDVRNVYDEKGDYYFDKKDYKKAIVYYNMAFKMDANNYYSVLRKAEAYTALDLNEQAAESYRIIFETTLSIPNEYRLQYAMLLLKNKDIIGYEKWMSKYNDIVNSEIKDFVSSTDVRAKMYKDTSFVFVENESLLNTSESEICPTVYKDKVLFSSTRKNLAGSVSSGQYNLFTASYNRAGQLGRLNVLNTSLNSEQNEFSVLVFEKTNKLSFTRGSSTGANLKTYFANIPENENIALGVNEFKIEGFANIGHVTMNSTGTKMYFVSDAPGGIGGLDIYYSELTGGKWSKPKNMGSVINSTKDEMFPIVLNDTMLYFSSAGHNSYGGLDLFSFKLNRDNATSKNLGNTVNTKYDDYSLSFSREGLTGYFCSNRPGGFGKEDIYRLHLLDIKVKHAAYKFKRKSFMEDKKINLYLSDGEEFNISSPDNMGFDFSFQPGESYKMIVQHENPTALNIINNPRLSSEQRKKEFLNPSPFEKNEIQLEIGMKYDFTAGMRPISADFKKALADMSSAYQNTNSNTIDLTALAKELQLREGEVYTIRFVKDESQYAEAKTKTESNLIVNNQAIGVAGRSFFIVLPLDIQASFNIQTDIAKFKETFNPKKVGTVAVDATPVLKEEPVLEIEGFPILVNTESFADVSKKKIMASELTIIPGSMYILTLKNTNPGPEDNEIVIPLTKGVKYNLGTQGVSQSDYYKAINQLSASIGSTKSTEEELIDIRVLSKELDILSQKNIVFCLMPIAKLSSQDENARSVMTTLSVDGRKYYVTNNQKIEVNLKLDKSQKMNIQTDLSYVKENFDPSTIAVNVDTTSFNKNLKEKKSTEITDPVFDVIVVNFNLNEYTVRTDAKTIINDKVIQVLKGDKRLYVTIKGYTDALGNAEHNEKLSQNRAQAVKDFLTQNGIGESRIRTFSYGASMALKEGEKWENLSEEELQKHRKVEIVIYLPK